MVIAVLADVFAVARCISNMEGRLDAAGVPAEAEGFVEASLHVFWEVTTTRGRLTIDLLLDKNDVLGEISDIEPVVVLNISVGDEADPDGQTLV